MHLSERIEAQKNSHSALSSAILATSLVATFAAGSLALGSFALDRWLAPEKSVSVNLGRLGWWSSLDFSVNRPSPEVLATAPEVNTRVGLHLAKASRPRLPARARPQAIAQAPAQPILEDTIQAVQAAVVQAPVTLETEQTRMRGLHGLLRRRFQLAMNTQIQEISPTEITVSAPGLQEVVALEEVRAVAAAVAAEKPAVSAVPAPAPAVKKVRHRQLKRRKAVNRVPAQLVERTVSDQIRISLSGHGSPSVDTQPASKELSEPEAIQAVREKVHPFVVSHPEPGMSVPEPSPQTQAAPKAEPENLIALGVTRTEYSGLTQATAAPGVRLATRENPTATTQVNPGYSKSPNSPNPPADPVERVSTTDSPTDYSFSRAPQSKAEYVEAFQWSHEVGSIASEVLSLEGRSSSSARWVKATAPDHWPTLRWKSSRTGTTPLVSHNTALLLAAMTGSPLQENAGLVFGHVPAGWAVSFSGRSERAIYVDENNSPIPPGDTARDRYFAFVNASPGAHLLHLLGPSGESRAAVLAPVTEGAATYVEIPKPAEIHVSGRVYDAGSARAQGVSQLTIRVVGQTAQSTFTAGNGTFALTGVLAIGDQPLFIEIEGSHGFAHRYRVTPERARGLALFRFDESQVRAWLDQLEGGISPDSGLVIGALPQTLAAIGQPGLLPAVSALSRSTTLSSETYTLSADDRMQVKTALDEQHARFVSVQVPEGANLAQVEDKQGNVVWSELVVSSPGVVNVVGPY